MVRVFEMVNESGLTSAATDRRRTEGPSRTRLLSAPFVGQQHVVPHRRLPPRTLHHVGYLCSAPSQPSGRKLCRASLLHRLQVLPRRVELGASGLLRMLKAHVAAAAARELDTRLARRPMLHQARRRYESRLLRLQEGAAGEKPDATTAATSAGRSSRIYL